MMNTMDVDFDGLVNRHEAMRMLDPESGLVSDSGASLILRPDYSETLFKAADQNKDGWLNESEMTAYLNPLYEAHMHRALAHDIIEEMKKRLGTANLKIRDLVSQSRLLQEKAAEYAILMEGTTTVNVLIPLLRALALHKAHAITQHYFEVADSDQVCAYTLVPRQQIAMVERGLPCLFAFEHSIPSYQSIIPLCYILARIHLQDGTLGLREMLKHIDLFYDVPYGSRNLEL